MLTFKHYTQKFNLIYFHCFFSVTHPYRIFDYFPIQIDNFFLKYFHFLYGFHLKMCVCINAHGYKHAGLKCLKLHNVLKIWWCIYISRDERKSGERGWSRLTNIFELFIIGSICFFKAESFLNYSSSYIFKLFNILKHITKVLSYFSTQFHIIIGINTYVCVCIRLMFTSQFSFKYN